MLDLSAAALEVTRKRLGEAARRVDWIVGDVTAVEPPPGGFDVWHDRSSRGHVIIATFGPDGPFQCSGLPVVRYAPDALHAAFGDAFVHDNTQPRRIRPRVVPCNISFTATASSRTETPRGD